jgi:hypothetical protein
MQNKANFRGRVSGSRGESCQTNPIRPSGQAWPLERQTVRNKPNSCRYADQEIGVPGRADCAKQSQFAARLRGCGRGPFPGRLCRTKPIASGDPLKWAGGSDTIVTQATDLIRTD